MDYELPLPPPDAPSFTDWLLARVAPTSAWLYTNTVTTLFRAGGSCGWGEAEPAGHTQRQEHMRGLTDHTTRNYTVAWNQWRHYVRAVYGVEVPVLDGALEPAVYADDLAMAAAMVIRGLGKGKARLLRWNRVDVEEGMAFTAEGKAIRQIATRVGTQPFRAALQRLQAYLQPASKDEYVLPADWLNRQRPLSFEALRVLERTGEEARRARVQRPPPLTPWTPEEAAAEAPTRKPAMLGYHGRRPGAPAASPAPAPSASPSLALSATLRGSVQEPVQAASKLEAPAPAAPVAPAAPGGAQAAGNGRARKGKAEPSPAEAIATLRKQATDTWGSDESTWADWMLAELAFHAERLLAPSELSELAAT